MFQLFQKKKKKKKTHFICTYDNKVITAIKNYMMVYCCCRDEAPSFPKVGSGQPQGLDVFTHGE
jgi:hypothetical protein